MISPFGATSKTKTKQSMPDPYHSMVVNYLSPAELGMPRDNHDSMWVVPLEPKFA